LDKMETTENLGLKKPSQDDYYNVDDFNYNADAIDEFCGRTDNPHNVTKEQVGLGNVPNVSTNDQIPTFTEAETLTALKSGEKLSVSLGKIAKAIKDSISHFATKATASVFGHVKLTDSSAVTDGTGLALPATEKNASISGTLANQISTLDSKINNKDVLKVLKSDWSGHEGIMYAQFNRSGDNVNDIVSDRGNGTYPPVRVARADADGDGNRIKDTYAKKTDFNTNLKQVSITERDKYLSNTWSYAGPNGLSIDSGIWLVSYYVWFSANTGVPYISIKSTRDEVVGATAPTTSNGTFLEMHEIISGQAISNLLLYIYVPTPTTFGQISFKTRAIKLR